jgi:5-methylcytosine-specific restriction enzyme subunit McrC
MNQSAPKVIELEEYVPVLYAQDDIPQAVGRALWDNYRNQVAVDAPSFKNDYQWQLTAQGWVGYIPLTADVALTLKPKVALGSLFGMLEYAYRLKSFRFLDGLADFESLEEFYERLANVLARRVLDRSRKGLYRAYLPLTDELPYVRGRMDMRRLVETPWSVRPRCRFEEHTADLEENQLLHWTLWRITRSGVCTERVLPTVRCAYRALKGFVSVQPFTAQACMGRLYNRLNDDYQPMHALCRFFLEQTGPSHRMGDHKMLPFLVDMARLYELFVAEWLKAKLSGDLVLKPQERVYIGQGGRLYFQVDLLLVDATTGEARCVLDTKYKAPDTPAEDDIAQVVAYAEATGCQEAVLVYPKAVPALKEARIGGKRVRTLTFSLEGDLEEAGNVFLRDLLCPIPTS